MARLKTDKYTLVMHSGGGYADKPGFKQGVEERHLETEADLTKVQKAGGLVFDTYSEAVDRAEAENFPDDSELGISGSFYPHVRGSFASVSIDGLRVYIPPKAEASV